MIDRSRLPSYAFMSPEETQRQVDMTENGTYDLTPFEKMWRSKQLHLNRQGYSLRPRYSIDWKPSWMGTNINPLYCEDSITSRKLNVIDAKDSSGKLVAIKRLQNKSQEIEIAQFLTALEHPHNHCVSVIEVFEDPEDPAWSFMVMPYLRSFDNPEFELIGEVVEFVRQMLEGLAFLHSNRIAHRDIAPPNVMMDGKPLYPQGHHPVRTDCSVDCIVQLKPLRRMDVDIKYYYVDFGLSTRFSPGTSSLVVGNIGRDSEFPERSRTVPYDAYKADIHALGNVFYKEFQLKYHDTDFLKPLVDCMKQRQPELRPPASELVTMFQQLCKLENPSKSRWRLSPRSESAPERMVNDTIAAARDGLSNLRRFVG